MKMPTTSHADMIHTLGTPRLSGQAITPKTYRASKSSRYVNHLSQSIRIAHQRVNIDVDLTQNKLEGFTELTVVPTMGSLKSIKLDCREMKIKDVYINNTRNTNYIYRDVLYINDDKYFEESLSNKSVNLFDMYSDNLTIHQHHLIRQKLNYVFGEINNDPRELPKELHNGNTEELLIFLPDNLKLELADANAFTTPESQAVTPRYLKSKNTMGESQHSFTVKIEFECINPKNGLNFITDKKSDKKYWHAYTVNSDYNISTSSWVPCIDNLWDRCTWSLEINIPRTIKDIGNPRIIGSENNKSLTKENGTSQRINKDVRNGGSDDAEDNTGDIEHDEDNVEDDEDDNENYDLVICTGDFNNVKETPHPIDSSKKVVSWSIFNPVCAHHVGWALGSFQSIVLSTPTQDGDEEIKDEVEFEDIEKVTDNSPVTIYFLVGQADMARNTCILANKAIDFFLKEFGSFPFSSYAMVFVQNNASESNNFAGLSLISDSLLYPSDLIEPMISTTDTILEGMASQWSGINIVPLSFNDYWCTIGIARYMALQFIRVLMGKNEYRFKIKKKMNEIVEKDIGKKPLALQFFRFPISDLDLDFLRLKAPIVLYILDKRMTKTDKSFGLSRVLPKLFLQAMSGDLQNGALSTQHFQYVCEKVNRNKLDTFFKQWVFGSGVPIFNISQKFNKKRSMIEMSIRQVQQLDTKKLHPNPESFINDSIAHLDDEPSFLIQPVFTGPMTIRIHEADGTPYEHIVDLKDGHVKLDIQYNTKFKRLKKNREDLNEPNTTFSKLGDVLTTPEEMDEWGLNEWVKRDEDMLYNDAFEWIRVDADYEWIAQINVKQPDYMFGSQLQYDRDVEAQYEAVRYFGDREKPNTLYCTALTRTVMDDRYYYGLRIAAAQALADISKPDNNFIGIGYLIKIFKELFCFPGSSIPLSNDFNNFNRFFLQKQIPQILSNVRDENGEVPFVIRNLLLNLVKFNENSNNTFQDCFYMSDLITSLTTSALNANSALTSQDPLNLLDKSDSINSEKQKFLQDVITEINRLQKLDEWVPSYQSIIAITCIKQKVRLATHGLLQLTFEDLLYYTLDKYPFEVRIEAFRGLLILGGLKNASILQYYLKVCLLDAITPYFRGKLIDTLINAICIAAIDGTPSTLDDPEFKTLEKLFDENSKMANNQTNMVIIEDGSNNELNSRRDTFARATLNGAIELLRRDYSIGKGLKNLFWELLHTSLLSIYERRNIFNVCQVLYKEIDSFIARVPVPSVPLSELKKKIVLRNMGDGKVVIKREGRFKIQLASRRLTIQEPAKSKVAQEKAKSKPLEPPVVVDNAQEPKLKLKLGNASTTVEPKKEAPRTNKRGSLDTKHVIVDPKLVTIDPHNKSKVTIKFKKHTLPNSSVFDFPTQAPNPPPSLVKIQGSTVKLKFSKDKSSKIRDILNNTSSKPRYVKILTKEKRIFVSPVPFSSTNPSIATKGDLNGKLKDGNGSPSKSKKSVSPVLRNSKSNDESMKNTLKNDKSKEHSAENSSEPDEKKQKLKIPLKREFKELSEPMSKPVERSVSPFSRSASPFSPAPPLHRPNKKTKIYIHPSDEKSASSSMQNEPQVANMDVLDSTEHKAPDDSSDVKSKKSTSKPGIKLKLSLKR
ncbi:unnamed protein product [Debaryomyces fabryi]|nr:unnamed protein product [Debaryomyces fabryi]